MFDTGARDVPNEGDAVDLDAEGSGDVADIAVDGSADTAVVDDAASDVGPEPGEDASIEPCEPGSMWCLSPLTAATCGEGGAITYTTCPDNARCVDESATCEPLVCEPFEQRCASAEIVETCRSDGQAWVESRTCPQGTCEAGECGAICDDAAIFFVLDHSGSMGGQWSGLVDTMLALGDARSDLEMGFAAFPTHDACGVGTGWPLVAVAAPYPPAWSVALDSIGPPQGGTPLLPALSWVADNAAAVWADADPASRRVVVLMSDGGAGCTPCGGTDCYDAEARAVASRLHERGILMYTVAFGEGGDVPLMSLLASLGGTGRTAPLRADSATDLLDAFIAISDEAQSCE